MTGLPAKRRVLLQSSSERLRLPVVQMLESAGHEVALTDSPSGSRTWLRIHRADLVILDLDFMGQDGGEAAAELAAQVTGAGARLLALARAKGDRQLRALFQRARLFNFLAVGDGEVIDPVEFNVTVSKILTGDIFGLERYLSPRAHVEVEPVRRSNQRTALVDRVQAFAASSGCHARVAQSVAVAADELLTNALYDAPLDSSGRPRFAHLPRSQEVSLAPEEEITLTMASDGRRVGLAAADPFGSLTPDRVVGYLSKCYARAEDQIDDKAGGAGLGLYTLFNAFHEFVINIAPGRRTEVIGLLEATRSFKQYSERPKSFNVFVSEGR